MKITPKEYENVIEEWAVSLPTVSYDEIKLIFENDRYDGPLTGMCLYEGKKVWFHAYDDTETVRKFFLVELTPEEIADEEYWQRLFEEKVGFTASYDESGRSRPYELKPQEMHHEFYDAYAKREKIEYVFTRKPFAIFDM